MSLLFIENRLECLTGGSFTRNPFVFENCKVTRLSVPPTLHVQGPVFALILHKPLSVTSFAVFQRGRPVYHGSSLNDRVRKRPLLVLMDANLSPRMTKALNLWRSVGLVTGAASGIGRACAQVLVEEGCTRIVLSDLSQEGLEKVSQDLKEIDPKVDSLLVVGDMSSEADVDRMVEEGARKFGAIHYCINSAGVTSKPRLRTHELDIEAFDRVMNINLRGLWLCERAQIRQFLKQPASLKTRNHSKANANPPQRGAIVNISSIFGITAHATAGAYPASKAGVLGLTRTDAVAYGTDGIRVNAICPGFIDTPLVQQAKANGTDYTKLVGLIPFQRMGTPEELAEAAVWLVSERASYVSGVELPVDGAWVRACNT